MSPVLNQKWFKCWIIFMSKLRKIRPLGKKWEQKQKHLNVNYQQDNVVAFKNHPYMWLYTCVLMQPKVFMTWYEDFFICMILYAKGASCYQYYQGTEDFFFQSISKELADAAQWNRLTVQKRPIINLHSNTNF